MAPFLSQEAPCLRHSTTRNQRGFCPQFSSWFGNYLLCVVPLLHSSDRTICSCACRKPPLFFCATGNFLPSLSSLQLDALIWRQLGTPQRERERKRHRCTSCCIPLPPIFSRFTLQFVSLPVSCEQSEKLLFTETTSVCLSVSTTSSEVSRLAHQQFLSSDSVPSAIV